MLKQFNSSFERKERHYPDTLLTVESIEEKCRDEFRRIRFEWIQKTMCVVTLCWQTRQNQGFACPDFWSVIEACNDSFHPQENDKYDRTPSCHFPEKPVVGHGAVTIIFCISSVGDFVLNAYFHASWWEDYAVYINPPIVQSQWKWMKLHLIYP